MNRRHRCAHMAVRASVNFFIGDGVKAELTLKGRKGGEVKMHTQAEGASGVVEDAFVIRSLMHELGVPMSRCTYPPSCVSLPVLTNGCVRAGTWPSFSSNLLSALAPADVTGRKRHRLEEAGCDASSGLLPPRPELVVAALKGSRYRGGLWVERVVGLAVALNSTRSIQQAQKMTRSLRTI